MFTVEFAKPFSAVPHDVLIQLRAQLQEIGRSLDALPGESPVWVSLEASGMLLELDGWRFQYGVDRRRRRLVVDAASQLGK